MPCQSDTQHAGKKYLISKHRCLSAILYRSILSIFACRFNGCPRSLFGVSSNRVPKWRFVPFGVEQRVLVAGVVKTWDSSIPTRYLRLTVAFSGSLSLEPPTMMV